MAIVRDYKSWDEYRAALAQLPPSYPVGGRFAPAGWSGDASTIGEALAVADRGWPEGMAYARQIVSPAVENMAGMLESLDVGADVTGAAFDVGEFLNGTPECWITPLHTETKPCVTIAMHTSTSAAISAEVLIIRGAAVAALTLALQQSGYATRVYAIDGGTVDDSQSIWIRACLTDDNGGPLDMDRMVFALAHPAASRQLAYGLEIALAGASFDRDHSLGWPRESGSATLPPPEWEVDLYLHASHWRDLNWNDPAAVNAWVKEMYEKLTGRHEGETT